MLTMNASWMLVGLGLSHCVCIRTFAAGGLKAGRGMRNTAHVHMEEDSAPQTVSVLLSQRTTFK